jgi:hypothetical protein
MQLNPQQPDPLQQRIFNWMPVMFTFLLASFSVGLVIYWAWNNVLSLLQQYTIMKKNGAEIHLWKNMGLDKAIARVQSGQGLGTADAMARGSASMRRGAEQLGQRVGTWKKTVTGKLQRPGGTPPPKSSEAGTAHAGVSAAAATSAEAAMTREQALKTLGLEADATATEIDAAYRKHARQNGSLNGSEKLSQAREILRGKEGT